MAYKFAEELLFLNVLFYTPSQTGYATYGGKKEKERKEEDRIFKHSSNKQNACSY